VRRLAALALGLGAAACASPDFEMDELPAEPIAFVYRSVEESERLLKDAEQAKGAKPAGDELRIDVERLERQQGLRTWQDRMRDQLGRISFYVAPERRIEASSFALRGARPLDWSEDRQRLLFTATQRAQLQLFEWRPASGEIRQLTRGAASHGDGCYGPDGALAWVRLEADGAVLRTRIWVQRPGEAARALSEGPSDTQPDWAPDGSRLVYTASDPAQGDVLRWIDPATGQGGMLGRGRAPVFTPDGQWIVYSGRTAKGWKLWRMRPDGSGKRTFGRSAFQESDPAVSPDGRFVVFSGIKSEDSPTPRLWVRSFEGTADRHLEFGGSGAFPVW
jgi:hypothetical protein